MNKIILLGLVIFVHAKMAECWCCGCPGGYPCAATEGCNIFCCNCAESCQRGQNCKGNKGNILPFFFFEVYLRTYQKIFSIAIATQDLAL